MKRKEIFNIIIVCIYCICLIGCGGRKEQSKNEDTVIQQLEDEKTDELTEIPDDFVTNENQEDKSDEVKKPTVSQNAWESTDSTNNTESTASQPNISRDEHKPNEENKENSNDNTQDESTDAEETTEPALNVDSDDYFPLLP